MLKQKNYHFYVSQDPGTGRALAPGNKPKGPGNPPATAPGYNADVPVAQRFPADFLAQDGACACLELADAGSGIPSQDIEKIFDPLFPPNSPGTAWARS